MPVRAMNGVVRLKERGPRHHVHKVAFVVVRLALHADGPDASPHRVVAQRRGIVFSRRYQRCKCRLVALIADQHLLCEVRVKPLRIFAGALGPRPQPHFIYGIGGYPISRLCRVGSGGSSGGRAGDRSCGWSRLSWQQLNRGRFHRRRLWRLGRSSGGRGCRRWRRQRSGGQREGLSGRSGQPNLEEALVADHLLVKDVDAGAALDGTDGGGLVGALLELHRVGQDPAERQVHLFVDEDAVPLGGGAHRVGAFDGQDLAFDALVVALAVVLDNLVNSDGVALFQHALRLGGGLERFQVRPHRNRLSRRDHDVLEGHSLTGHRTEQLLGGGRSVAGLAVVPAHPAKRLYRQPALAGTVACGLGDVFTAHRHSRPRHNGSHHGRAVVRPSQDLRFGFLVAGADFKKLDWTRGRLWLGQQRRRRVGSNLALF